jgi:hypothetical protein
MQRCVTQGVGAFDKDYWLLPLHKSCGGKVHWGLAIICHTGRIGQRLEQLSNQQQQQQQRVLTGPGQPCIIYLESYGEWRRYQHQNCNPAIC